jgi:hypothetical protein
VRHPKPATLTLVSWLVQYGDCSVPHLCSWKTALHGRSIRPNLHGLHTSWAITIGLGDNVDVLHQPLLSVLVLSSARAHISSSVRTEQCRLRCNGRSISVYTVSVVFIRGRRRADSDVAAAWTSVVAMQTWTPSSTCRHGRPSSLRAGQTPMFSRTARGGGVALSPPVRWARVAVALTLVHRDRSSASHARWRQESINSYSVRI